MRVPSVCRRVVACSALAVAFIVTGAGQAHAEVTRITITSRKPALNGQAFGTVGTYEEIKGIAYGELDPKDRRNALITDIEFAAVNARGRVEYRTTFTLLKPVDMTKSSGVLFYNIVNRGGHNGPNTWGVGGDPGDGFLYRLGQAVLWAGWQGDLPIDPALPDREGIDVPIARHADGSPVTGPVWARFVNVQGRANTQSLPGAAGRTPLSLDTTKARLISATSASASTMSASPSSTP